MSFNLKYKRFGAESILVEWSSKIEAFILSDILSFKSKLEHSKIFRFTQINTAYNSLLIIYNKSITDFEKEISVLKSIYKSNKEFLDVTSALWKIPVCYDEPFGIDLEAMSSEKRMTKEDIIKKHTQNTYTVYFIGFLPGFLYLGGLDEVLMTPRKSSPRLKVNKGAVAIGGNQTGVYPSESPGGWNIIGNTPIDFFNIKNDAPCFAKPGDKIQFYPVSLKTYQDIKTLVDANVYVLEEEKML